MGIWTAQAAIINVPADDDAGAIDVLASEAITMYPNPGKNRLVLESSINMKILTVTNMLGQGVAHMEAVGREAEMSMVNLGSGVYLVRVFTRGGVWTQKWRKE